MTELIVFYLLLFGFAAFDLRSLKKTGGNRELIPYLCLVIITCVLGYLYLLNPMRTSISSVMLNLFGLED